MQFLPNFITPEESTQLSTFIFDENPKFKWTQLRHRRLINLGGIPQPEGMLTEPIPPAFKPLIQRVEQQPNLLPARTNHILVNEYLPGHGIMAHEDGPLYHPMVVIVSILSGVSLGFRRKEGVDRPSRYPDRFAVYLPPNSLVSFSEELYTDYLHEIQDTDQDVIDPTLLNLEDVVKLGYEVGAVVPRAVRVSFTMRVVIKTKSKAKILGGQSW
eukprot:PhF_6_TR3078/c0_g1_i1/m.4525/K10768/ALKBH6; alkylated DNA repair protein alkB homolog 6